MNSFLFMNSFLVKFLNCIVSNSKRMYHLVSIKFMNSFTIIPNSKLPHQIKKSNNTS